MFTIRMPAEVAGKVGSAFSDLARLAAIGRNDENLAYAIVVFGQKCELTTIRGGTDDAGAARVATIGGESQTTLRGTFGWHREVGVGSFQWP